MNGQLKRIDDAVYRAERTLVIASLLIMSVVVFLDVVHRGFAGEASKFAEVGLRVAGLFGALPAKDAPEFAAESAALGAKLASASPYVLFPTFTGLAYFGIRSSKRAEPVPAPTAAMLAVAGVLAAYGLVRVLIWAMPGGLVWSQPMALVLTLWVGFIGASMCTYERKHLKVEAVQRHIPDRYKATVAFVSGVMTTIVCLVLLWVSLRYVRFNYEAFVQTEGRGGLVKGWAVPRYQAFAALPIAFTFMSVRFFARSILALQGKVAPSGDTLGLAKVEAEGSALPQSEVQTEAIPADGSSKSKKAGVAPSDVDTMTSQPAGAGVLPQSKVTTDPHDLPQKKSEKAAGSIGKSSDDEEADQ